MIQNLHHAQVSIPVGSEEEAKAFYCGVLGLHEIERPEILKSRGGFWLQLGAIQIHFGTEDGIDRNATRAHLAYQVTDLNSWRARLNTLNIKIRESTPIPGYSRFEFRDPFGNRVEFLDSTHCY